MRDCPRGTAVTRAASSVDRASRYGNAGTRSPTRQVESKVNIMQYKETQTIMTEMQALVRVSGFAQALLKKAPK